MFTPSADLKTVLRRLLGGPYSRLAEMLSAMSVTAAGLPYDNTDSGLSATDTQAAIDEVAAAGGGGGGGGPGAPTWERYVVTYQEFQQPGDLGNRLLRVLASGEFCDAMVIHLLEDFRGIPPNTYIEVSAGAAVSITGFDSRNPFGVVSFTSVSPGGENVPQFTGERSIYATLSWGGVEDPDDLTQGQFEVFLRVNNLEDVVASVLPTHV